MRARVYKSTGSWYVVKTDQGQIWNARIKGIFKIDGITSTNPISVGDEVHLEIENESEGSAVIISIYPRRNYINRQSPSNKMQHHIIAANLDQSLMMATLKDPRTSQGFVDRFLVASEAYHVPAMLVVNKMDLYRKKEMDQWDHWQQMYEAIGYPIFSMSIMEMKGLEEVRNSLEKKITLISGHSGVGKSSFINGILPGNLLKTQEVSGWSGKGIHTTTFAEMFDLSGPGGGSIIDTPGMREFGLVDISRQELSHYFPEMRSLIQECKFNNCLHQSEPGCAIKNALEEGNIYEDRYNSYCNILESIVSKGY
jgi:ribosome biogenesis GTPase